MWIFATTLRQVVDFCDTTDPSVDGRALMGGCQ